MPEPLLLPALVLAPPWLHAAWAAICTAVALLAHRTAMPVASGLLVALLGPLALQLVRYALAEGEPITLAAILPAYLFPALFLDMGQRLVDEASALRLLLARARDLALVLATACAVLVVNGLGPRPSTHPMLEAAIALSAGLLSLELLYGLRRWLPAARLVHGATLVPAFFAARQAWRLFGGDASPTETAIDIGILPLVNALLPAFLVPALLFFRLARQFPAGWARTAAGGSALLFALAFLDLAIRQLFRGAVIVAPASMAERFAAFAAWLLFALACQGLAMRRPWRAAGWLAAATVSAAAARLLLFETAVLSGGWLVASCALVAGVALALVAVRSRARA